MVEGLSVTFGNGGRFREQRASRGEVICAPLRKKKKKKKLNLRRDIILLRIEEQLKVLLGLGVPGNRRFDQMMF